MVGTLHSELGAIYQSEKSMVVHKALKAGEEIPSHNHEGKEVFFTVVKGEMAMTLNGEEAHTVTPGHSLQFNGKNFIAGKALQDSEIFIFLIGA